MATKKKEVDNDYKGIFEDSDAQLTMVKKPKRANRKAASDLKKALAGEKKKPKRTTKK